MSLWSWFETTLKVGALGYFLLDVFSFPFLFFFPAPLTQGRRARRALMFLRSYSDLHVDLEIKEMERSLLAQGLHRRSHKTVSSSSPNRPKRASANAKASAASESNQNISYNPMLPPDEKPYPDTPEHSLRKSGGGTDDGTEMCAAPPRSLSSSSQSANHSADDNDCFGCAVLCAADIQRPLGMGIAMMIFQRAFFPLDLCSTFSNSI